MFVHTELRSVASHPRLFTLSVEGFTLVTPNCEGLGGPSSFPAVPQQLLFYKHVHPVTNLESTLLEVFILRNLKLPEINTFQKTGRGVVVMVNQLLEASHSLSSSPLRFFGLWRPRPPILRMHFQVPYHVSPAFATLTKTPGVWGYSSQIGTALTAPRLARMSVLSSRCCLRFSRESEPE